MGLMTTRCPKVASLLGPDFLCSIKKKKSVDLSASNIIADLIEAVWITILIVGSQIGCTLHAEVDRTSVIDALDDIFLKIQNKLVFVTDDL